MNPKIDKVLARMEAELLKRGAKAWTTGTGYRRGGSRCLTGMVWHHSRWQIFLSFAVEQALAETVNPHMLMLKPGNFTADSILITYNDHKAKNWQDILHLIKRTRARISDGYLELPTQKAENSLSLP